MEGNESEDLMILSSELKKVCSGIVQEEERVNNRRPMDFSCSTLMAEPGS